MMLLALIMFLLLGLALGFITGMTFVLYLLTKHERDLEL